MSPVCRICFAGNTRLQSLQNNLLIEVYDRLSNNKFNFEDSRPRAVCSFCYQKLLRCHTFSQMAQRSEKIFSDLCGWSGSYGTQRFIAESALAEVLNGLPDVPAAPADPNPPFKSDVNARANAVLMMNNVNRRPIEMVYVDSDDEDVV